MDQDLNLFIKWAKLSLNIQGFGLSSLILKEFLIFRKESTNLMSCQQSQLWPSHVIFSSLDYNTS